MDLLDDLLSLFLVGLQEQGDKLLDLVLHGLRDLHLLGLLEIVLNGLCDLSFASGLLDLELSDVECKTTTPEPLCDCLLGGVQDFLVFSILCVRLWVAFLFSSQELQESADWV